MWFVGSSIIKHAHPAAISRPGGPNLSIPGLDIWWQGYSGLRLVTTKYRIRTLARLQDPPHYILLHIGGNDIGVTKLREIMTEASSLLHYIRMRLPNVRIIWSQILPRTSWRSSDNVKAMNDTRIRLNSYIAKLVLTQYSGYYIKHPTLTENMDTMLWDDGVHLNKTGNDVFLNSLQAGLEFILTNRGHVYPE